MRRPHATRAVRAAAVALLSAGLAGSGCAVIATGLPACKASTASPASGACPGRPVTAHTIYVLTGDNSVVPIRSASGAAGPPIHFWPPAGSEFITVALLMTPDGKTLYVFNGYYNFQGNVVPIRTATNTTGKVISAGDRLTGAAITPDDKTAYVAGYSGTVTPIAVATNTAGAPIQIGGCPSTIAITSDGESAYASNGNSVTPIQLATNTPGRPVKVAGAGGIVITP